MRKIETTYHYRVEGNLLIFTIIIGGVTVCLLDYILLPCYAIAIAFLLFFYHHGL